jgi:hypothetical protein
MAAEDMANYLRFIFAYPHQCMSNEDAPSSVHIL